MKKFLFKIAYSLRLYRLTHSISPSLYWNELTKQAHASFYIGLNDKRMINEGLKLKKYIYGGNENDDCKKRR